MSKKQVPRIVKSVLTKPPQWYVLTRYREKRGIDTVNGEDVDYLCALEKFDVTDQMVAILAAHKSLRKTSPKASR